MAESHERVPRMGADSFSPEKGEEVFRGNFLRVTIEQREGRTYERVYVRNGISVIPVTSEGNLRFIREIDWDTQQTRIKLVSGYIHDNEDPLMCAQRELAEEVGLTAEQWKPLHTSKSEEATVQKAQHFFMARGLQEGAAHPEADERIEGYIDLTPQEVRERALGEEFGSGATAFALLKLVEQMSVNKS